MESTCKKIQGQIPELLTAKSPVETGGFIRDHINRCPACSKYLQALQADDKLLADFAKAVQSTVAGLESTVIDALGREESRKPGTSVSRWREIMKSPITKVVVAATIIIAVLVGINYFGASVGGTSVAFGDVMEKIYKARTVTYKETFHIEGLQPFTTEKMVIDSGHMRTVMPHGDIIIFDLNGGKHLHLMPRFNRAILTQRVGRPRGKRLFNYLDWISKLHEETGEFTGREEVDGKTADVFVVKNPLEETTVWVDPGTNLPVRVEMVHTPNPDKNIIVPEMVLNEGDFGGDANESRSITITSGRGSGEGIQKKMRLVMSDFVWDAELDECLLFNLKPPEGYTVEQKQFDVAERGENDLIDALAFWTEMSGGLFPSAINDLGDPNKMRPMLVDKFDRDGEPKGELDQAMKKMNIILKGLMFAQRWKADGSWRYAGDGVYLGDSEKAICWWRPEDSKNYRAIYGDLSVGDLRGIDSPEGP
ncbi:MAG: hypothetical protein ACYTEQ_28930 [Planctomycetota bacterium]|jgi:hypothetical protein